MQDVEVFSFTISAVTSALEHQAKIAIIDLESDTAFFHWSADGVNQVESRVTIERFVWNNKHVNTLLHSPAPSEQRAYGVREYRTLQGFP